MVACSVHPLDLLLVLQMVSGRAGDLAEWRAGEMEIPSAVSLVERTAGSRAGYWVV